MGKEEKERRQEAEDKLKGNDDKVYTPPQGMNPMIAKIYMNIVEELKSAKVLNNLLLIQYIGLELLGRILMNRVKLLLTLMESCLSRLGFRLLRTTKLFFMQELGNLDYLLQVEQSLLCIM